jgi:mono/diheme cytochrome c family protein
MILTTAAVVVTASALGTVAFPKTGSAAYYTTAQATSGQKDYNTSCASCHGVNLDGVKAPALAGEGMAGSQSVADIYGFMAQQMPAGAPGSLSTAKYATIMAYILKKNGHPAGKVALTAASVKKITAKI